MFMKTKDYKDVVHESKFKNAQLNLGFHQALTNLLARLNFVQLCNAPTYMYANDCGVYLAQYERPDLSGPVNTVTPGGIPQPNTQKVSRPRDRKGRYKNAQLDTQQTKDNMPEVIQEFTP